MIFKFPFIAFFLYKINKMLEVSELNVVLSYGLMEILFELPEVTFLLGFINMPLVPALNKQYCNHVSNHFY